MNDSIDAECEHIFHANGIHEFILKEYGMTGADAIMNQFEELYQSRTATLTDPPLHILIVNGPGVLPINYSMQRAKELNNKYPNVGMIRIALLSDSAFEARLVDSFVRLMRFPGIRLRFFGVARRADADQWLLQDN